MANVPHWFGGWKRGKDIPASRPRCTQRRSRHSSGSRRQQAQIAAWPSGDVADTNDCRLRFGLFWRAQPAQRTAIERIGQGGRFGIAVGSAGSGTTAMLKPMVTAWREQGREVYGVSLAWRQADGLVAAGIEHRNLKAFSVLIGGLRMARSGWGRNRRSLLTNGGC
jgi:hypothetical protein